MIKRWYVILGAVCIDGLALITEFDFGSLGLVGSSAAAATVAGAAAYNFCSVLPIFGSQAGGWCAGVGAAAGGAIGAIAAPFVAPGTEAISLILGALACSIISLTIGTGFMTFLAGQGLFYPEYVLPGAVLEYMPFLNLLPGWTLLTVLCVLKKESIETGKKSLITTAIIGFASSARGGPVVGALGGAKAVVQQKMNDVIKSPLQRSPRAPDSVIALRSRQGSRLMPDKTEEDLSLAA